MIDTDTMEELAVNPFRRSEWLRFLEATDPKVKYAFDLAENQSLSPEATLELVVCCLGYHKEKEQNENSNNGS